LKKIARKRRIKRFSYKKQVIFIDEMPCFDTHKSGFITAFDHFWNNWASKQDKLVVVICRFDAALF
jgi:hypothetical protein